MTFRLQLGRENLIAHNRFDIHRIEDELSLCTISIYSLSSSNQKLFPLQSQIFADL
jgi:hypothetical protein